jgi:hypothetical protein
MNPNPPADHERGVVVAGEQLLARSDHAAVILRTAVAYTTGVRFTMTALLRTEADGQAWHDAVMSSGPAGLQLAFQWHELPTPPLHPACSAIYDEDISRSPIVAGGGGTHYEIALWLSPLRPQGGALDVYVSWQQFAIPLVATSIPVPDRAHLADNVQQLWTKP